MRTMSPTGRATLLVLVALAFTAHACDGCAGGSGPPPLPPVPNAPPSTKAVHWEAKPAAPQLPATPTADPSPEPELTVAPAAAAPQGSAAPASVNGDPNGISRAALNGAIQGTMGSLASCFAGLTQNPMVAVSFEADPSGRASMVRVNGAPPDAERCIRATVQGMRLPKFEGGAVHVDLPLAFHQVGATQRVTESPAPSPSSPPLFVQP